jgi:hypothetical protein
MQEAVATQLASPSPWPGLLSTAPINYAAWSGYLPQVGARVAVGVGGQLRPPLPEDEAIYTIVQLDNDGVATIELTDIELTSSPAADIPFTRSPAGSYRPAYGPDGDDWVVGQPIFNVPVAEWSNQIAAGDPIAINDEGHAYARVIHGVDLAGNELSLAWTHPQGVALTSTEGPIGDGEARISLQLGGQPLVATPTPIGPPPPPPPVPTDPVELPNLHLETGENPAPLPVEDDITELTHEEQEMLERVLGEYGKWSTGHWSNDDQEIFDSLFNKLVD